jgi:hypothetical protein
MLNETCQLLLAYRRFNELDAGLQIKAKIDEFPFDAFTLVLFLELS